MTRRCEPGLFKSFGKLFAEFVVWVRERPLTRVPVVIGLIVLFPVFLGFLALYEAVGAVANLLFVAVAIVVISVVAYFTIHWFGAGWILLTVPVTFGLLVPPMIVMSKLNRRAGFGSGAAYATGSSLFDHA